MDLLELSGVVDLGNGEYIEIHRAGGSGSSLEYSDGGSYLLSETEPGIDTALQTLYNGIRLVEVIKDAAAPRAFEYRLELPEGSVLLPQEDGSFVIGSQHTEDGNDVLEGGGFRVVYPYPVTVQLNKNRTSDAADVGAAICIGIAFVPAVEPVIAAICGLHNAAIRASIRYGYCQQWNIDPVLRTFRVAQYQGGWCT